MTLTAGLQAPPIGLAIDRFYQAYFASLPAAEAAEVIQLLLGTMAATLTITTPLLFLLEVRTLSLAILLRSVSSRLGLCCWASSTVKKWLTH